VSTRRHGTGAATRPGDAIDLPVASLILKAERPLVMLGAGANRPRLSEALSAFVTRATSPQRLVDGRPVV